MRKFTFWLSSIMLFMIPWEDSIQIPAIGSLARLFGFLVAGFWFLTVLSEKKFRKPHIFHALALFFFLWNILSYIWTADIPRTIVRMLTYGQIFLLLLIVWELYRKPSDMRTGLQAYVLGSYVCIGSSLFNFLRGTVAVQYEIRYSATGVNANDLALLLSLSIPIAWHLILQADRKKNRLLKFINIAYIPLAIFAILLTGSRTSLFALIPAVIFIVQPKRLALGQFMVILIFLVISLFVILAILPQGVIDRLATTAASIGSEDIGGRFDLWRQAISVFLQAPILGIGSGAISSFIGSWAHQTFLSILAETGPIGLLLFLAILAVVINQTTRLFREYSGLWFSVFFVWVIGNLSLSWEMKKVTWLFLSFVIIDGEALKQLYWSEKLKTSISETEKGQYLPNIVEE